MINLQYIKHHDIDFDKWDHTILSSQFPLVFAQSFYLNATCPNWDALIVGNYESVFPITQKNKLGIAYLHQPPFTPQLGLFGKVNIEIEQSIFDYLTINFKLIEIELNASNSITNEFSLPKTTYIIDYKNEFKQNQNTKRNVNKALELGLKFETIAHNEILNLSATYLNPFLSKQLNLSKNSISLFNNLLQSALTSKTLQSFKVVDGNNNIKAMAHFISNGKHTVYLKGTNFDKSENSGSMHLLTSYAINHFKNTSNVFDFGGGSKLSLATFYKGFGGSPFNYKMLKINKLPWLIKLLKNKF